MSININFSHYLKTFGQLIQKIMGNESKKFTRNFWGLKTSSQVKRKLSLENSSSSKLFYKYVK